MDIGTKSDRTPDNEPHMSSLIADLRGHKSKSLPHRTERQVTDLVMPSPSLETRLSCEHTIKRSVDTAHRGKSISSHMVALLGHNPQYSFHRMVQRMITSGILSLSPVLLPSSVHIIRPLMEIALNERHISSHTVVPLGRRRWHSLSRTE